MARIQILEFIQEIPFPMVSVRILLDLPLNSEHDALVSNLRQAGRDLSKTLSLLQLSPALLHQLENMLSKTSPEQLCDVLTSMIDITRHEKLDMLAELSVPDRIEKCVGLVKRQIQVLKISQKLQSQIQMQLGKKQRQVLLRKQLESIKKELGESDPDADSDANEIKHLEKKLERAQLPKHVDQLVTRDLARLSRMNPGNAEYQVLMTYLEWISDLPWKAPSPSSINLSKAKEILDQDHQGLFKVKTRILEYMAVCSLTQSIRGPILCLVGPPGVGKTSLGKSIAKALDRSFDRIALGGVRDEAQIRGHRRTYVGALPGLLIQAYRKVGVNNPVFLLDEIDKLGSDGRSDPTSAFLEVLDPEQNHTFTDAYLNVPFDLSKTLFIATANDLDRIPGPLRDRMVCLFLKLTERKSFKSRDIPRTRN